MQKQPRLTEQAQRRYLKVAPMAKHRATARRCSATKQSLEERGQRPSGWAACERDIRAFVRFARTNPYPLINQQLAAAAEEEEQVWATKEARRIYDEWLRRCERETEAQGRADLLQLRFRSVMADARLSRAKKLALQEELDEALRDHGDAVLALVGFGPVLRGVFG